MVRIKALAIEKYYIKRWITWDCFFNLRALIGRWIKILNLKETRKVQFIFTKIAFNKKQERSISYNININLRKEIETICMECDVVWKGTDVDHGKAGTKKKKRSRYGATVEYLR